MFSTWYHQNQAVETDRSTHQVAPVKRVLIAQQTSDFKKSEEQPCARNITAIKILGV